MKLELKGITKVFGPLVANDQIDLVVEPGEIHALLGENGAGKSTLMNVLYGMYRPDDGQILIDGQSAVFKGPGDAVAAGIGMVHQHFMLVPVFTVAESVALGYEPMKGPLFNKSEANKRVLELSARFGFDVDPNAVIEDLPVGVQQRVEIIKALSREAKVLILDEPTAVLTPQETDELIEIMRQLKAAGTSIVFITHKLREVKAIADRITVIRRGKVVGQALPTDSEQELASKMVGRSVDLGVDKSPAHPRDVVLEFDQVSLVDSNSGQTTLDHISFGVRRGEILCIAGVQGNGQTELCEVVLGSTHPNAGQVILDGKNIAKINIKQRLAEGLGYVPEDRQKDGMIGTFSVAENMILDVYDRKPFATGISMHPQAIEKNAETLRDEFDVRLNSVHDRIDTLSGGNQQKAILSRELSRPIKVLVAAQPTRGLDVGSIEFVHQRIVEERDAGAAVLVVSTELDEVFALADRIAVMYRGRIVGIVPADTSRDVLGLMMAGIPYDEAIATENGAEIVEKTNE